MNWATFVTSARMVGDVTAEMMLRYCTYLEAVNLALSQALEGDARVILLGEDMGLGASQAAAGLLDRFGSGRVLDFPRPQTAIVGAAVGMALAGLRPVVELASSSAYDQLLTEAADLHYRFGIAVPLVVRAPAGGLGAKPHHPHNQVAIYTQVPELKVVCPGSVQDAYDLLLAAVEDPSPVVVLEDEGFRRSRRSMLRLGSTPQFLGQAMVRRPGKDISLITHGGTLPLCLEAAGALAAEGISTEVVDLRTVNPLDMVSVARSVRRTGRAVIVDQHLTCVGAEVAARLAEEMFFALDRPILRVAVRAPALSATEHRAGPLPGTSRIIEAVRECSST